MPLKRSMILIFSHRLTEEQEVEAKEKLGVEQFIHLPKDLQKVWSGIPAEGMFDPSWIQPLIQWLDKVAKKDDFVLVQGEFGVTYYIVDYCFHKGLQPIYATTTRESIENCQLDGRVIRQQVFKHRGFRFYQRYGQPLNAPES